MNVLDEILFSFPRELHKKNLRKRLKHKDFTLLTQNCVGGVIYHMLGMKFLSPTINMYIEDENFTKLIENLHYYLSLEPYRIKDIADGSKCPVIGIDDIEICCLHYKTCEEAIQMWNKRKARVNYDKILVIGNSWNMHGNHELIERVLDCKFPSVVFTYGDYSLKNCIMLSEKWTVNGSGDVKPALTGYENEKWRQNFEPLFDIVKWINSSLD